jgi:hypothetical protein
VNRIGNAGLTAVAEKLESLPTLYSLAYVLVLSFAFADFLFSLGLLALSKLLSFIVVLPWQAR